MSQPTVASDDSHIRLFKKESAVVVEEEDTMRHRVEEMESIIPIVQGAVPCPQQRRWVAPIGKHDGTGAIWNGGKLRAWRRGKSTRSCLLAQLVRAHCSSIELDL